jgi:hypothetical protein
MSPRRTEERRELFVYDSQVLIGVIQPLASREWRVIVRGRELGIFNSREQAIAALENPTDGGGKREQYDR